MTLVPEQASDMVDSRLHVNPQSTLRLGDLGLEEALKQDSVTACWRGSIGEVAEWLKALPC